MAHDIVCGSKKNSSNSINVKGTNLQWLFQVERIRMNDLVWSVVDSNQLFHTIPTEPQTQPGIAFNTLEITLGYTSIIYLLWVMAFRGLKYRWCRRSFYIYRNRIRVKSIHGLE